MGVLGSKNGAFCPSPNKKLIKNSKAKPIANTLNALPIPPTEYMDSKSNKSFKKPVGRGSFCSQNS